MVNRTTPHEGAEPKTPRQVDDESGQEISGRFPADFYKYSQDFRDREDGAPGTDQDFGTRQLGRGKEASLPKLMPEGDGDSESTEDRQIREEVVDALSRDLSREALDVSVRVEDGIVTLSGTIARVEMKTAIEDCIEGVPGVDDVVDCLVIGEETQ